MGEFVPRFVENTQQRFVPEVGIRIDVLSEFRRDALHGFVERIRSIRSGDPAAEGACDRAVHRNNDQIVDLPSIYNYRKLRWVSQWRDLVEIVYFSRGIFLKARCSLCKSGRLDTWMRTAGRVVLDQWGRAELACLIENAHTTAELQRRARIIEMAAGGASDEDVARALGISAKTVSRWRRRYLRSGLTALRETAERRAPRRAIDPEKVEQIVRRTLQERPARGGAWSSRAMAAVTGVSEATVRRIWREYNIRPRSAHGPASGEMEWFFHGLYLEPGTRLLVLIRERKDGYGQEPGLPALTEETRGSRAALLLRLLVARSGGVAGGSGQERLRRFLHEAVPASGHVDVLVAVEGVSPEVTGRIGALLQSEFPAARMMGIASHVEWVQMLESSVARLEKTPEGRGGEILAAFGGRIHRYLENAETTFDWAGPKAKSAHMA